MGKTNTLYFNLTTRDQKYRAFSPDFALPIVAREHDKTVVFPTLHHYYTYLRFDHPDFEERVIAAWTLKDLIFCESTRFASWFKEKHKIDVGDESDAWKSEDARIKRLYEGNALRFEQNPAMIDILLDTEDDELVFDTGKYDNHFCTLFGINEKGAGENLLGKDLMYMRGKFRDGKWKPYALRDR